jgi:hypothetical protein
MEQYRASHLRADSWSSSLTHLASDLGQVCQSTFVRYIYMWHTTLAPMSEESLWLNEEKKLIGKKIVSRMSAWDVTRVVSLVY